MKFLVLHGYGQNGAIFRKKHAAVERRLLQKFPDATFVYPTAPIALRSDDRPEDLIDSSEIVANAAEDYVQDNISPRGWCLLRTHLDVNPGLNKSLDMIAHTLTTQGPFDGIIAFSQGTYIAAMVISLLEGASRRAAYEAQKAATPECCFEYPASFDNIAHPPLKCGVLYSGFMAQGPQFDWLYEGPRIQTPLLHFVGAVDPVLEDQWREAMLSRVCGDDGAHVIIHPGAHHVPTSKKHLEHIVPFVEAHMQAAATAAVVTLPAVEGKRVRRADSVVDLGSFSAEDAARAQDKQATQLVRKPRRAVAAANSTRPREASRRRSSSPQSQSQRNSSPRLSPVPKALGHPSLSDGSIALAACTQMTLDKDVKGGTCTVKLTMELHITCPVSPPQYVATPA